MYLISNFFFIIDFLASKVEVTPEIDGYTESMWLQVSTAFSDGNYLIILFILFFFFHTVFFFNFFIMNSLSCPLFFPLFLSFIILLIYFISLLLSCTLFFPFFLFILIIKFIRYRRQRKRDIIRIPNTEQSRNSRKRSGPTYSCHK